jgi:surfeit locus 1 family protein
MPRSISLSPRLLAGILIAVAVIGVCTRLGFWQLERGQAKAERLATIAERAAQPPRSLAQLLALRSPAHYPVEVQGRFDNARSLLLDNRIHEGRAGYFVLTPLRTDPGQQVLVNRGWIPRGPSREQLPQIPAIDGHVTVRGRTYVPPETAWVLGPEEITSPDWPLRIQQVDMQALEALLGVELAPFEIRVAPGHDVETGEEMLRDWPDSRLKPERHYAYAVQWFAMALAALIWFLVAAWRYASNRRED